MLEEKPPVEPLEFYQTPTFLDRFPIIEQAWSDSMSAIKNHYWWAFVYGLLAFVASIFCGLTTGRQIDMAYCALITFGAPLFVIFVKNGIYAPAKVRQRLQDELTYQKSINWRLERDLKKSQNLAEIPEKDILPLPTLEITSSEVEILSSEKQVQQQIEILWDKANSKYRKTGGNESIYIGVRNLTGESIHNLKVHIEHLYAKALPELDISEVDEYKVPLREKNDTPPYKQSFTLNPNSEMLFYIGEYGYGNRNFMIYQAASDEPFKLRYHAQFNVIIEGDNMPPSTKQMSFLWKDTLVSP